MLKWLLSFPNGRLVTSVVALTFIGSLTVIYATSTFENRNKNVAKKTDKTTTQQGAYLDLIGNTPIVELRKLSLITGCHIFVKVSFRFFDLRM